MSSGATAHAPTGSLLSALPVGSLRAALPVPAANDSSSEDVASVHPDRTKSLNLTPSATTALTTRGRLPAAREL